jgi:predicted transglutaminase-like cysteine proteinase
MHHRCADQSRFLCRLLLCRGIAAFMAMMVASRVDAEQIETRAYPAIFGSREIHSANLTTFPKWRSMLERFAREVRGCPSSQPGAKQWCTLIDGWRSLDRAAQLRAINDTMNQRPYIADTINWRQPDYWETPLEFTRKGGDCEDYAIAKYMALKELGVPIDDIRIVVLQDLNLRIAHAILVVYVAGEPVLLDNQVAGITPVSAVHHYEPVYSINEHGWWLHRSGTPRDTTVIAAIGAPRPTSTASAAARR